MKHYNQLKDERDKAVLQVVLLSTLFGMMLGMGITAVLWPVLCHY